MHAIFPGEIRMTPIGSGCPRSSCKQTRVNQGRPYYERFTERFPTLKDLAEAKDEEVMKLWEGLGYYSRARNLLKAARLVQEAYDGRFPNTAEGLEKLPGIGPYTAAAIASFAFGQAIGVVDGNVFRLLSRLFDIDACIDDGKNRPIFQALADELIDKEVPGTTNQALMEIGADLYAKAQLPKMSTADPLSGPRARNSRLQAGA